MPHRTHIGALDPRTVKFRRLLVRHWLDVALMIWGKIGDGKIGIVLLDRYWSGKDPWVTADYTSAALRNLYSDDTVRRRLKELVDNGAVLQRKEGRTKLYAFRPSVAEEITTAMEQFSSPAKCGQNLSDNRNLRDNLIVVGPIRTHMPLVNNEGTSEL